MAMFSTLAVGDVGALVRWYWDALGIWGGDWDAGADGGLVLGNRRRWRRCWVLVQGWSEAYWVQPRNAPLRALRGTMTPARQDWQTGGVALQKGLVQRDERPAMTRKPRRQR